MDFAWLAVVGVLLLLAGLSALGFDTLRQRHRKKPYDFPEIETTLLDIPASSPKSVGAVREPAPKLSQDIAQAAGVSGLQIVMRASRSHPAGSQEAENERARLKADVLLWGEYGPERNGGGAITASLALGPDVNTGYQPWQQW